MPKKSRGPWMSQHLKDPFVRQAQKAGYRSRAAFKLQQLNAQDHLLKPGMTVIDLGAAPGSWSQIAKQTIGRSGRVLAVDLLAMEALPGVEFIQGDFLEEATQASLSALLGSEEKVDLILSDISPNLTGQPMVDQAKALRLWQAVLTFAQERLKIRGALVIKLFQGSEGTLFQRALATHFEQVFTRKPDASRSESREFYLVAKNFKGI